MIDEEDEILKTMRGTPLVLERLVRDLPDDAVRARPAEGEWAIIEVVAHLGDTDERALARTRRMLTEDEPALEPPPGCPSGIGGAADRDSESGDAHPGQ